MERKPRLKEMPHEKREKRLKFGPGSSEHRVFIISNDWFDNFDGAGSLNQPIFWEGLPKTCLLTYPRHRW